MDDPPAPRDPGDTGEPIGDRRQTGVGGSDTADDSAWQDPAARPNRHDASDVSVPVMTMSVLSNVGVERDPDAIVEVRTGAATADFDDLFRTHYDRLVRVLTVACGDREQAADAVQEAFVKAHVRWRRIGRYDDPVGWVRRVAINQVRDEHRRAGRKRRALVRLAARTPRSPSSRSSPTSSVGSSLGSPVSSGSRPRCTTSTGCPSPRSRPRSTLPRER